MDHQPGSEPQPDPFKPDSNRSFTPDQPIFNEPLLPPAAQYLAPSEGTSTPRDSYITNNSAVNSAPLLEGVGEKDLADRGTFTTNKPKPLHKRPLIWALAAIALALIVIAVVVPVYFTVIKPKNNTVTGGTGSNNGDDPNTTHDPPTSDNSGGDGSTIKTEDGNEFTYSNPYGGICGSINLLPPQCF
jgi:glucan 1,3-beta-glucosidase